MLCIFCLFRGPFSDSLLFSVCSPHPRCLFSLFTVSISPTNAFLPFSPKNPFSFLRQMDSAIGQTLMKLASTSPEDDFKAKFASASSSTRRELLHQLSGLSRAKCERILSRSDAVSPEAVLDIARRQTQLELSTSSATGAAMASPTPHSTAAHHLPLPPDSETDDENPLVDPPPLLGPAAAFGRYPPRVDASAADTDPTPASSSSTLSGSGVSPPGGVSSSALGLRLPTSPTIFTTPFDATTTTSPSGVGLPPVSTPHAAARTLRRVTFDGIPPPAAPPPPPHPHARDTQLSAVLPHDIDYNDPTQFRIVDTMLKNILHLAPNTHSSSRAPSNNRHFDIKIPWPRFKKGDNLDLFLRDVEEHFRLTNYTDTEKILQVLSLVDDVTSEYMTNCCRFDQDLKRDYLYFRDYFVKRLDGNSTRKFKEDLKKIKQNGEKKERVPGFSVRLRTAFLLAHPNFPRAHLDYELSDRLIDGLYFPEVRRLVQNLHSNDMHDFDKICDAATLFENNHLEEMSRQDPASAFFSNNPTSAEKQPAVDSNYAAEPYPPQASDPFTYVPVPCYEYASLPHHALAHDGHPSASSFVFHPNRSAPQDQNSRYNLPPNDLLTPDECVDSISRALSRLRPINPYERNRSASAIPPWSKDGSDNARARAVSAPPSRGRPQATQRATIYPPPQQPPPSNPQVAPRGRGRGPMSRGVPRGMPRGLPRGAGRGMGRGEQNPQPRAPPVRGTPHPRGNFPHRPVNLAPAVSRPPAPTSVAPSPESAQPLPERRVHFEDGNRKRPRALVDYSSDSPAAPDKSVRQNYVDTSFYDSYDHGENALIDGYLGRDYTGEYIDVYENELHYEDYPPTTEDLAYDADEDDVEATPKPT